MPNADNATGTLIKEWAEKEKVEVQIDFIATQGNKLLLTGSAEAQAMSAHAVLALTNWLPSRYSNQLVTVNGSLEPPHGPAASGVSATRVCVRLNAQRRAPCRRTSRRS